MNETVKMNDLEARLNATRMKLHEQTKDMTPQERVAFFNDKGRDVLTRHGIKAGITEMPVIRRQM
jgi:hypothetical protein